MSNWEVERKEYVDKLATLIKGIDKILELNSLGVIESDTRKHMEEQRNKARRLLDKLDRDEFEIAIVGLEKAGKSTFANALMGIDILPTKDSRCTYTAASIRYDSKDCAEIEFYSMPEFEQSFRERLQQMQYPHADQVSFSTLNLAEYDAQFEKLDNNIKQIYGSSVSEDIRNILTYRDNLLHFIGNPTKTFLGESDLSSEYFKGFIQDPKFAIAVKEITIRSSRLQKMPNAVVYDVPGFDSPTQMHKDQTIEKMRLADAIILIADAYKPSFTGPLVDVLRTETDYDGVNLSDKIFVFANRADMATTLEANMEVIKNDLRKYHTMRESDFEERVIPGSAKASLEKAGKLTTHEALDALKLRNLLSDGVQDIIDRMAEYSHCERFDVLKKRVNKTRGDVIELCKEVLSQKKALDSRDNLRCSGEIATEILEIAGKAIREKLASYRAEVVNDFSKPNAPLTAKLNEQVIDGITLEKYGVTDEEFKRAKDAASKSDPTPIPAYTEKTLREWKNREVYNSFAQGVVDLAIEEHSICDQKIVEIFMTALGITSNNVYYHQLRESIELYITENKGNTGDGVSGYYRSLVDRFSNDMFELMLLRPFGDMSRWNKFEQDKQTFYSLSMFDDNFNPLGTPDEQPMHYMILFHDINYCQQTEWLKAISKVTVDALLGNVIPPQTVELLKKVVKLQKDKAIDYCKGIFAKWGDKKPLEDRNMSLQETLSDFVETHIETESTIHSDSLDQNVYESWFSGKRNKTDDTVREELNDDIEMLRIVLKNMLANAIQIEKPFRTYQARSIDNLISSLDSGAFRRFVVDNAQMIEIEKYKSLETQDQMIRAQAGIMEQIRSILQEMESMQNAVAV